MKNQTTPIIFYALISSILIALFHYYSPSLFSSSLYAAFGLAILSFILIFLIVKRPTISSDGKQEKQSIKTPANQFTKIGEAIGDKASNLAINSAEISFFLTQLSTAIESSSVDVDRLATAAEQMSVNSKHINDNAGLASEQANQAMSACNASSSQLTDNITIVNQLNESVNSAADKIKLLEQKASEIQSITDVIDGISSQTNLLALNAAIEAARALSLIHI